MSFGLKISFGRLCRKTYEEICEEARSKSIVMKMETEDCYWTLFKDGSITIINKKCLTVINEVRA